MEHGTSSHHDAAATTTTAAIPTASHRMPSGRLPQRFNTCRTLEELACVRQANGQVNTSLHTGVNNGVASSGRRPGSKPSLLVPLLSYQVANTKAGETSVHQHAHVKPHHTGSKCKSAAVVNPQPSRTLAGWHVLVSFGYVRRRSAHHTGQAVWVTDPLDLRRTQPHRLGKRVLANPSQVQIS